MSSNAPLDNVAYQIEWAGSNMAYNLGFIPADKLDWKPAPEAGSALDVALHAAGAVGGLKSMMTGEAPPELAKPATLEAAQELVKRVTAEYAQWLRGITAEKAAEPFDSKIMGVMPFGRFAMVPAIDFLHHHGQIAYIQTLLGDTESHFEPQSY